MNTPILQMRGITKTFPGVKALQDVTLEVNRGEVHAICGENGAGKSTLMKVLSGVYPHSSFDGDILFENEPCNFASISDSEKRGIVIIHQELALSPYLSIAENIYLGNEQATRGWVDWRKTNLEAAKLLARVGLSENPVTPVQHISVGKQQLVEIAKALSKEVKLLILDEPTAALNDEDSGHLLDLILHLKGQGVTSIIISHKLNEIRKVADAVTIIRDGKTDRDPPPGRRRDHPGTHHPRHGGPRPGKPVPGPRHPEIGEEVLRIEDWSVRHPQDHSRMVVNNASLNVRKGEVVGLAGLMGAGRTELAMSVFGRTYGTRHVRQGLQARRGNQHLHRVRRHPARHRLRHRGPQALRPEPHRGHQAQHLHGRPAQARQARLGGQEPGNRGGQRLPEEHEHQGAVGGGHHRASSPAATSRKWC